MTDKRPLFIKSSIISFLTTIILIAFDQFTKHLAVLHLKDQSPIVLIKDVFQFQYLENNGAAFGMLEGKKVFFIAITIVFLVAACFIFYKIPLEKKFIPLRIVIVFLSSGAIGNMIDRMMHRYVIDFFYFDLINFPIFNIADIYVTLSAITLFILFLFYYKEDDLNQIFPSKKGKEKS